MGYYALGGEVLDTTVPHRWPKPAEASHAQTVCWLWPRMWVVEVEDPTEGATVTDGKPAHVGDPANRVVHAWFVYRVDEADAYTMLRRWGHGPDIWICACEECLCPCGESVHTHPTISLAPGEPQLGACSRLHAEALRAQLTREYQERRTRKRPDARG